MQILFLGTGSGKVSLTRGHTSILFREKNDSVLVDCGEGTSRSLLQWNISHDEISNIVFSHFHSDHIAGLPGLITQMKLANRNKPLNIHLHNQLKDTLLNLLNSFFLFVEGIPFRINILGYEFGKSICINDCFLFRSAKNNHIVNKYNIEYVPAENFISSSFLFTANGKNIYYTADIGISDDLFLFEDKIDYLIAETTHIQPEKLIQSLIKYEPEKILLTHIDDNHKIENWYNSLDKKIKKYFLITSDGMELSI